MCSHKVLGIANEQGRVASKRVEEYEQFRTEQVQEAYDRFADATTVLQF